MSQTPLNPPHSSLASLDTVESDYRSVADELEPLSPSSEEDEEEEGEEGQGGEGDAKGARKGPSLKEYEVVLDRALLDFDKDEGASPLAALLEIIRKLKLAAPSDIIKGTSTFGPEHPDITLRELGLLTERIAPKHAADPYLLKKLDAAQKALRLREGIPHPDDHWRGGDSDEGRAGVSEAAVGFLLNSMVDNEKPQEKTKAAHTDVLQERDEALDDTSFGEDDYSHLIDPRTRDLMSPPPAMDMSDIMGLFDDDLQFDAPDHVFEASYADTIDVPDREQMVVQGATEFVTLTTFFNAVVALNEVPVERVALNQELHLEAFDPNLQHFDI